MQMVCSRIISGFSSLCRKKQLVFLGRKDFFSSRWSRAEAQSGYVLTQTACLRKDRSLNPKFHLAFHVQPSRRSSSSMSTEMSKRMVWVDLEMTGLDIEKDQIIEMACIITDSDLNILAEGPNLIIKQPDKLLDEMSDWCKEHHGQSGLTQAVRESKISLQQAEYEFLSFVRQHTPPGQCPLAGNSVHADKRFLEKYMPQFMSHLHYRIIDVSTVKELCSRWFPDEYKMMPHKRASHRALDDIRESLQELLFYRSNVFKVPKEQKKRKIMANGSNNEN